MRLLVLLLIVAGLAWVGLKVFPTGEEALAAGPDQAGVEEAAALNAEALPLAPAPARPAAPAFHPDNPVTPTAAASGPAVSELELTVGHLLARGATDQAIAEAVRGADEFGLDRVRLLRAYAAGGAGDLDAGQRFLADLAASGAREPAPSERERALLAGSIGRAAFPPPRWRTPPAPVAAGLELALLERAYEAARNGSRGAAEAAAYASRGIQLELDAPWATDRAALAAWTERVRAAQLRHRWDPRGEWPSVDVEVRPGDSLVAIRVRHVEQNPEQVLSVGLIEKANGVRDSVIHPGETLRIPTDPVRVLVDLDARWMLYFLGSEVAAAYPIGIGAEDQESPTGDFAIGLKQKNPSWFPRGKPPVPFGSPDNPLGTRWLEWNQEGVGTHYGFHGTKDPESIGGAESMGCIRLHQADVEELFEILPQGAAVHVRD